MTCLSHLVPPKQPSYRIADAGMVVDLLVRLFGGVAPRQRLAIE
jgi:hypothetical protein